jgi:hypothetical protein
VVPGRDWCAQAVACGHGTAPGATVNCSSWIHGTSYLTTFPPTLNRIDKSGINREVKIYQALTYWQIHQTMRVLAPADN